ncbi:hypothetical protein DSM1535_0085 [Methanobacterium formicicum]|uniref:Uncharacterized protein n=1 Tax=Methanobacterium formicicum TaxID=2162 RepID=A0A090JSQ4_METFO|nr:hypothetical protein DSM1535_0085 [Methanobacterium formicicum]
MQLKSDYFRIEMSELGNAMNSIKMLKSDYFRIEIACTESL